MQMFRILGKRGRITIPFEIRQNVGFKYNDVLSFMETDDGRSVIIKREKLCNNCKQNKPLPNADEVTLFDFLNGLSAEQQRAALVHLSVKWAERQASNAGNMALNTQVRELGSGSACRVEPQKNGANGDING